MDNGLLQILAPIATTIVVAVVLNSRKFKQQTPETSPLPEEHASYQEEEEMSSADERMRKFFRMKESMQTPLSPEVEPHIDLIRYQEVAKQRSQERNRKSERDQRFAALFRDNESEQTEEKEGRLKDFNIKQAIIYSEIVNRKYE